MMYGKHPYMSGPTDDFSMDAYIRKLEEFKEMQRDAPLNLPDINI